jgi:hypothetical protein
MRKLLTLSVLVLLVAGTTGCFHNGCGGLGGGLFARRVQPTAVQCCQPCCPPPCCDPCAQPAAVPVTQMMPVSAAPCCQ